MGMKTNPIIHGTPQYSRKHCCRATSRLLRVCQLIVERCQKGFTSHQKKAIMTGPNRNASLYGPGPVFRPGKGPAAGPPLQGLVKVVVQGCALGLVAGLGYKVLIKDPTQRGVEEYYKKHPSN